MNANPIPALEWAAQLYVCEQRAEWAAALRQFQMATALRVFELRSIAAALEQLATGAGHVIVWQLRRDNLDAILSAIDMQRRQYPASCPLVVGEREMAVCEWLAREAGCVHAIFSIRRLDEILRIALRHLSRQPLPTRSWQEDLARQLPWPQVASADFRVGSR